MIDPDWAKLGLESISLAGTVIVGSVAWWLGHTRARRAALDAVRDHLEAEIAAARATIARLSERVTVLEHQTADIGAIALRVAEHQAVLARLEARLDGAPTSEALGRVHARIDTTQAELHELRGRSGAYQHITELMQRHLTERSHP